MATDDIFQMICAHLMKIDSELNTPLGKITDHAPARSSNGITGSGLPSRNMTDPAAPQVDLSYMSKGGIGSEGAPNYSGLAAYAINSP